MDVDTYASPEDRQKCAYFAEKFYQQPRLDREGNSMLDKDGTPIIDDWVMLAKKGDPKTAYPDAIRRLSKPGHDPDTGRRGPTMLWRAIEPAYKAWKEGQAEPLSGTPLSAWPGVSEWEATRLKAINIRTVEEIAGMTDSDCERYGMGAHAMVLKAKAFCSNKPAAAQAQQIEAANARTRELEKQLEDMRQQIAGMAERRGPGRPPKQEAAA